MFDCVDIVQDAAHVRGCRRINACVYVHAYERLIVCVCACVWACVCVYLCALMCTLECVSVTGCASVCVCVCLKLCVLSMLFLDAVLSSIVIVSET